MGSVSTTWLVGFLRRVIDATSLDEAGVALVAGLVEELGVPAAVVLRLADDELVVVASRGIATAPCGLTVPAELVGDELGDRLIEATGRALPHADCIPLVAGGDLFGALVVLAARPLALDPAQRELALAMADLVAARVSRAASYAALERSYAELKASREALARTERLRVLGQMAAGVSHDVRNILNPLGLQLEILSRRIDRDERDRARETIATMREVIRAGVEVVERLREFGRQLPEGERELVDVDRVVSTAVELTRPRLAQVGGVRLGVDLGAPAPILARGSELTTAIVNLVINAIEALGERGTITVSTSAAPDGTVIAVADDGPGMDAETERRVFEPFFTTKEEGTGLGLAMVFAFVQRYGGQLTLETQPGRGTRFTLWFPRPPAR